MSSCQCCFKPLPHQLLERYLSSIQSIKIIRKNSLIFEQFLLDQSEYFQEIITNSSFLASNWSRLIRYLNEHLHQSRKSFDQLEYLIRQCSIWLKTHHTRKLRRLLKSFHRRFEKLQKSKKGLTKFRSNYDRQVLQMDTIESEHLKIFQQSLRIFSSILSFDCSLNTINIPQIIDQWKEHHRFRIPWLLNEHQIIPPLSSSEIEIKPLNDSTSQDTFAHTSNLSWSFTVPTLSITSDQSSVASIPKNRVRLAVQAIEQNHSPHDSQGRKS